MSENTNKNPAECMVEFCDIIIGQNHEDTGWRSSGSIVGSFGAEQATIANFAFTREDGLDYQLVLVGSTPVIVLEPKLGIEIIPRQHLNMSTPQGVHSFMELERRIVAIQAHNKKGELVYEMTLSEAHRRGIPVDMNFCNSTIQIDGKDFRIKRLFNPYSKFLLGMIAVCQEDAPEENVVFVLQPSDLALPPVVE